MHVFRLPEGTKEQAISSLALQSDFDYNELMEVRCENAKDMIQSLSGYMCQSKVNYALVQYIVSVVKELGSSKSKVLLSHPKSGRR